MKPKRYFRFFSLIFAGLCAMHPLLVSASDDKHADEWPAGAVFTMTNAAAGNAVLMYTRSADGKLTYRNAFATGGLGSGGGLGNQGAVVLSGNHQWLFVVNAGSDEISVFAVKNDRLVLRDRIYSGGSRPVSLTYDRGLLYVLNAGSDNISGFTFSRRGKLAPLDGSTRSLSGVGTGPAQIEFSPDGDVLAVTEKATNLIDTFVVDASGLPGAVRSFPSVRATPFGFAFDKRGHLVVSEAVGGAADASSVSSYDVSEDGTLTVISPAVATTETAACWIVITRNGRYAYTTNAGSSSISGYRIARDGSLDLLDADGVTGSTGAGSAPIDMALAGNSRFMYALSAADNSISAFALGHDGSLANVQRVEALPAGVNGLAAY